MNKILAKSVHLGLGLDLLGSKTSLNSKRGNELEVTAFGVKAKNSSGRVVLIPWANIKGVELQPEAPSEQPMNLGPQEPKPRQPKKQA